MEASAQPGGGASALREDPAQQGDKEELHLTSLPDTVLANLVWPPERVSVGLCVCNKNLTRALLGAPSMDLSMLQIADDGATALAVTLASMTGLQELNLSSSWTPPLATKAAAPQERPIKIGMAGAEALGGALAVARELKVLKLKGHELGGEAAQLLISNVAEGLVHLDLGRNQIGSRGATLLGPSLQRLTHLEELCMEYNMLGPDGIEALGAYLPSLTRLQTLDLFKNWLGVEGGEALGAWLPRLTGLQVLELTRNALMPDGMSALGPSLRHLTNIRALFLGENGFMDQGMQVLGMSLRHLTSLRALHLHNNGPLQADLGGRALGAALRFLTELRELHLGFLQLDVEGVVAVAVEAFFRLTNLRKLFLQHNMLGVAGLKTLGPHLAGLSQLQELDVGFNQIGVNSAGQAEPEEGVWDFLTHLPSLLVLSASSNNLGPQGGAALACSLGALTRLTMLDLTWNRLGGKGAAAMAPALLCLRRLRLLDLRNNAVGEPEEVRAALPHIPRVLLRISDPWPFDLLT